GHGREHMGGIRRQRRQCSCRSRLRGHRRRIATGLEIAAQGEDQHCRHPSTHDARGTAHHVFPLLGTRPGKRLGECRQRRDFSRWIAQGQFAVAITSNQIGIMKASLYTMIVATMATALAAAEKVNCDNMQTGAAPPGWTAMQTGSGTAKWAVEKDDFAPSKPNVLKQSGQATFPVCFKNNTNIKDGFVEVKFKPIAGKEDQAGGVIWRLQDGNNYYIARANALEGNVTIYYTIKGKRTEKKRTKMGVASGAWHSLRVDFIGSHFTVTFDGKKAIEWDDDTFT